MCRLARAVAAVAFVVLTGATTLAAGEPRLALVPWKVVEPGHSVDAPLILYWIPASGDEVRRSPLLLSDELTLYSSRCVAMRVVRADDRARLARLDVEDGFPVVVLATGDGEVIGRLEAPLSVEEVEALVAAELDRRAADADARLDRARESAASRDFASAIALYESVLEERCMLPRQGKDAKRALKKLTKK